MGLTESDRDRQMQDAVRKFAQRAVKGVEIALFENGAAPNLLPATYQLDRVLRRMTVRGGEGSPHGMFLLSTASLSSWNDGPTNGGADRAASMASVVQDLGRIV